MNYENLKLACSNKGITLTNYLEEKGLNTGNTGKWKNGGNPSVKVLIDLATDLDVSTDYLLGLTDNPNTSPLRVVNIENEKEIENMAKEKETDNTEQARLSREDADVLKILQGGPIHENKLRKHSLSSVVTGGYATSEPVKNQPMSSKTIEFIYTITERGITALLEYIQKYEAEDDLIELLNLFDDYKLRNRFVDRAGKLAYDLIRENEVLRKSKTS